MADQDRIMIIIKHIKGIEYYEYNEEDSYTCEYIFAVKFNGSPMVRGIKVFPDELNIKSCIK